MNSLLRSFIQHSLLTERVFGKQAFVYHGSKAAPDVFISALLSNKFVPGYGDMYGKGLYTVYSEGRDQPTFSGNYGPYVYKLKVNLHGFIVFDPDVCMKVYGKNISPLQQLELLGDEEVLEDLRSDPDLLQTASSVPKSGLSSEWALRLSKFLSSRVKGIVFTGSRDGNVAVIYDSASVVPVAWSKTGRNIDWQPVDRKQLKPALGRSAEGQFEPGRFNFDPVTALKKGKRDFSGDLDLRGEPITSLPSGLKVGGCLYLDDTKITSLPAGLKVGGYLNLSNTKITSLPADLTVGYDLDLSNTKITSLPSGLKVGGNLDLFGTSITSLPSDLKVSGNIWLRDTPITSLSPGLTVGGNLDISNTNITSLPSDLKVGGDLWLRNTPITSLPSDLKVGGDLDISNTDITSLPSDLKVGGDLWLRNTPITSLPSDLKVGGEIIKDF